VLAGDVTTTREEISFGRANIRDAMNEHNPLIARSPTNT
jgi:hypothetical protein